MSKAWKATAWGVVLSLLTTAVGLSGNAQLIPPVLAVDAIVAFILLCRSPYVTKADKGIEKFTRGVLLLAGVVAAFWWFGTKILPSPDISLVVRQEMTLLPVLVEPQKSIYVVTVKPDGEATTSEIINHDLTASYWPQEDQTAGRCNDTSRLFEVRNTGSKDALNIGVPMMIQLIYGTTTAGTQSRIDQKSKRIAINHRLVLPVILSKDRAQIFVVNESHKLWLAVDMASTATVQTPGSLSEYDVPLIRPLLNWIDQIMPQFPLGPSTCQWSGVGSDA